MAFFLFSYFFSLHLDWNWDASAFTNLAHTSNFHLNWAALDTLMDWDRARALLGDADVDVIRGG
jgi:hypothetical protein